MKETKQLNSVLKKFGELINKEINAYNKEISCYTKEERRWVLTGIKNTVYLLGVSINEKEYSFADGFKKFCDKIGVDLSR